MAGDWIKFEKATLTKPEILVISERLNVPRLHAVGLCLAFWSWCDDQLNACHARSVTKKVLDLVIGVTGFADALQEVGWLAVDERGVEIPNFERHLSQSAKARALNTIRQRQKRAENVTLLSRSERDNSGTREEKRREDIRQTPIIPQTEAISPTPPEDAGRVDPSPGNTVSSHGRASGRTIFDPLGIQLAFSSERFKSKWREWCEYRQKKRKSVTEIAAKKQMKTLGAVTEEDAIEAIDTAIRNDWQGIFPRPTGGHRKDPSESDSEFGEADRGRAVPAGKYQRPADQ